MSSNKISKIDVLTLIIAFVALLTSISSIYFQFFRNSTEFSAKFTGTGVAKIDDTFDLEISLLFLNTGNTEVALISGFSYLSADNTIPNGSFSGSRENLDEIKKKWLTQSIDMESSILIGPGNIGNEIFKLNISKHELLEFLKQNFDVWALEEVEFKVGTALNFIDSKGKLKTKNITPSVVSLKYNVIGDSLRFYGKSINVNSFEMKQVINKYEIF